MRILARLLRSRLASLKMILRVSPDWALAIPLYALGWNRASESPRVTSATASTRSAKTELA